MSLQRGYLTLDPIFFLTNLFSVPLAWIEIIRGWGCFLGFQRPVHFVTQCQVKYTQSIKTMNFVSYDKAAKFWILHIENVSFRFSRAQRLTCLVTLVFSWMAVNAAWFRVAPQGKVDLYIGFKGYSYEELIIGVITAILVFPLNLLFFVLFRKSRQKEVRKTRPGHSLNRWPPILYDSAAFFNSVLTFKETLYQPHCRGHIYEVIFNENLI